MSYFIKNTPLKEQELSMNQNSYSCNENEIDGKYYNLDLRCVNYNKLYDELPIFEIGKTSLSQEEEGVFMWILITCEKEEPELYYMKVETKNEIGTKHSHMMYRIRHYICKTEKIIIHYAGEFKKEENGNIEWNFASGTYMLESFKEIEDMGLIERERRRNMWIVDVLGYLEYKKIKGNTFAACDVDSYISDKSCPLTKEKLDKYKRHGVKIYEIDSIGDCKNYMYYRRAWDRYKTLKRQYEITLQRKRKEGKRMLLKEPQKPVERLNMYSRKY